MTIAQWLHKATGTLKAASIDSAKLDAELLLCDVLGKGRSWLIAHNDEVLSVKNLKNADKLLRRREKHEPLAYIRGFKEFYGRDFTVTPDVLIPRPESESLIDLAKNCSLKPGESILDVGTGSGCLGTTIKCELPHISVTLLDISKKALEVATHNAKALQAEVEFAQQDLFEFTKDTRLPGQPFKLIVANLPYVDESWQRSPETAFEPNLALFSPTKGLWHIINLLSAAHYLLAKDGFVLLEADPRQMDDIEAYAHKLGFEVAVQDKFAVLLSRIPIDYQATSLGAHAHRVDHFHA